MSKLKKNFVILIDIILWTIITIPLVALLFECVDGFINGVYPGFNVDKKIYGIYAFCHKFMMYMWIFFPFVLIWCILFPITVVFTIYIIIKFEKRHGD